MRRAANKATKGQGLNRSRNKSRHNDSSNCEHATSSILEDKLIESLNSMNSQHKNSKKYPKNLKNHEKVVDQEKLKQKIEIKEKARLENKNKKHTRDQKAVNCKVLGNIIKDQLEACRITTQNVKHKIKKPKITACIAQNLKARKDKHIVKRNKLGNEEKENRRDKKDKDTEKYDLTQY